MDKLLVDTNIVIDLLSKREKFYKEAQELFTLSDYNDVNSISHLSPLRIPIIYYREITNWMMPEKF